MRDKALGQLRSATDDDLDLVLGEHVAEIRLGGGNDPWRRRLERPVGERCLGDRAGEHDGHVRLQVTQPPEGSAAIAAGFSDQHEELLDAAFWSLDRGLVDDPTNDLRRDDVTCLVSRTRIVRGVRIQDPILSGEDSEHAVVWYVQGSPRLSGEAAAVLADAEATDGIVVSVAMLVDLWYVTQTAQGVSRGLGATADTPAVVVAGDGIPSTSPSLMGPPRSHVTCSPTHGTASSSPRPPSWPSDS